MRYSIDHVLEGIQYARVAQLNSRMEAVVTTKESLAKVELRRGAAPVTLARMLQEFSIQMSLLRRLERSDYDAIRSSVTRHERDAPSHYDEGNLQAQVKRLQEQADELAAEAEAQNGPLEQFLRALQEGGETHVSQHGLKQAGFKAERVTDYIVARSQAQQAQVKLDG